MLASRENIKKKYINIQFFLPYDIDKCEKTSREKNFQVHELTVFNCFPPWKPKREIKGKSISFVSRVAFNDAQFVASKQTSIFL